MDESVRSSAADPSRLPNTAHLIVLSGPTAVGKGTVVNRLRRDHPDVWVSVSVTTRPPRPGEVDGVHYLFVDAAEFDRLIADGELLEWAVVHGVHRYGTPRQPVLDALAAGRSAILELDLQGARQVRQTWPEAHFVFLAPPTWEELLHRQAIRNTEDPAERERRLQTARQEMAAQDEFDQTIVNTEVGQAVADLVGLLGL
ncbi:guanylate kinase [Microlunatus elymi]|nr:guanylate kinase [Microlunatus elymi]